MLLCIEMMIFAVMHLFAFPWKIYAVDRTNSDPLNAPGSGWSGKEPRYLGGPLGIKAYAEAFNPWDMIKATARGIRWLFVGRRFRQEDVSYKHATDGTKLEPLKGPYTPDPNNDALASTVFKSPGNHNNIMVPRSLESSPSRMPRSGNANIDTSYHNVALPAMPSYPTSRGQGHNGFATPDEEFDEELSQQEEEDRAALLRNAADQGGRADIAASRRARYDDSENEQYHKHVENGSLHPAFRAGADTHDARQPWT